MRNTTDTLRRGLDSTLANWQLVAIRIVESFVFVLIIIGSIVAAIIPIAVAAGFSSVDIRNSDDPAGAIAGAIIEHWPLIFYVLAIVFVLFGVLIAVHSFVEAGNAKVFVDAERIAGPAAPAGRDRLRAFTIDRWLQGGRTSWWSVFWIYNIAWSFAGLILLVPLLVAIAGMLLVSDAGPRVAFGCLGLAIAFIVGIPVAILTGIWTQKAIAVCVARAATASAALRQGWDGIRRDLGRHIAVAVILFVITFGGGMAISMLTMPLSIFSSAAHHGSPFVDIAFAPARILTSFLQSIFSAAVGLWFLASFVGMTEER